jgi:hypothetical protein
MLRGANINLKNALRFVHQREHENGGFTLYHGIPDTKNTYYGIKTLQMFGKEPFNIEKTIKWIEKLQKERIPGIYGVFYQLNILKFYNREINVEGKYKTGLNSKKDYASLKDAYYHTKVSQILGVKNLSKIAEWILLYQNEDGGFGKERSDIESTYYALESLNIINPILILKKGLIFNFLQNCKTAGGGFSFIPNVYPPYIEPTCAAIRIHEIIGKTSENPGKTIKFAENLQNGDGGFRRSKYMGISELEYTFKSLYIIKSLSTI